MPDTLTATATPEDASPAAAGFVMPPDTPRRNAAAYPSGRDYAPPVLPVVPPVIAGAIINVCREVRRLRQDGSNTHDNYRFTSIDEFLDVVGGWCAGAGLIIIPEEVDAYIREQDKYSRGEFVGRDQILTCVYRFWLMHESGAVWQYPLERRVSLRAGGPQSYGAAESYVLKRFMRAIFKVPSGDCLDPGSDCFDPDAMPTVSGRPRGNDGASPGGQGDGGGLWGPAPSPAPAGGGIDFGPGPNGNGGGQGVNSGGPAVNSGGQGVNSSGFGGDDPLFPGRRVPPAPPRVTGRVVPGRGPSPALPSPGGQAASPGERLASPPAPSLTGGQTPFRVFNAAGEVVAEFRDLKTWGEGLKRHLSRERDDYGANLSEIDRLEEFFSSDPTTTTRGRKGIASAFASLRALAAGNDRGQSPGGQASNPNHDNAGREPGAEG